MNKYLYEITLINFLEPPKNLQKNLEIPNGLKGLIGLKGNKGPRDPTGPKAQRGLGKPEGPPGPENPVDKDGKYSVYGNYGNYGDYGNYGMYCTCNYKDKTYYMNEYTYIDCIEFMCFGHMPYDTYCGWVSTGGKDPKCGKYTFMYSCRKRSCPMEIQSGIKNL